MMTHDQIFITQLRIEATIGVHPDERLTPQTLRVDVELATDTRPAARSDALVDTIDYQQLTDDITRWAAERTYFLVETLVNTLADRILQTTSARSVRLCVSKFPPGIEAAAVGIVVVRP